MDFDEFIAINSFFVFMPIYTIVLHANLASVIDKIYTIFVVIAKNVTNFIECME